MQKKPSNKKVSKNKPIRYDEIDPLKTSHKKSKPRDRAKKKRTYID
jgi:hypothetical protein